MVTTEVGHLFVFLLAIYNFLSVNCLFTFAHFSSEFFSFDLLLPLYVADTNPLFYILQMFSPSLLSLYFPFFPLFHLIFF